MLRGVKTYHFYCGINQQIEQKPTMAKWGWVLARREVLETEIIPPGRKLQGARSEKQNRRGGAKPEW